MVKPPHIVFCNCAYSEIVSHDVKRDVLTRLCEAGVEFEAVADLCGLAARRDPALKRITEADEVRIAACFPRAVRWLFHAAGADLPEENVTLGNMRTESAEQVAAKMLSGVRGGKPQEPPAERIEAKPGERIPWFPVIDYSLCKNCKQCLNFCLFGVYSLSAKGLVEVRNPDKCKTNCPACARICPEAAIMFPKYKTRPINGDEIAPEDLKKADVNVDIKSLVGGDVYDRLRTRGRCERRFSTKPGENKAASKDYSKLDELKEQLDIPQEVLDSLGPVRPGVQRNNKAKPQGPPCNCGSGEKA